MKKIIAITLLNLLIFSCTDSPIKEEKENSGTATMIDSLSSCPFLTSDNKGNTILSWVKKINDSVHVICYATYNEGIFNNIIKIPSSKNVHPHGENMPKIVFKPSGEIIAAWGVDNPSPKKKYGGLVYYAQSFDEGKNWSEAKLLVKDTASIDQRYFDIAILQNSEAAIIWLDNRTKTDKEGSTLYYAVTNGKNGFENEKVIAETICQCCRTDLFIDSKGSIHTAYRDIINDSIRDMVHMVSLDGGQTFSNAQRISIDNWAIDGCPHTGPTMTENKIGLHFAWYTMGNGQGVFYCKSTDNGKTFSKRDSVSGNASAKHPQIVTLKNDILAVVWDEMIQKGTKYNYRIGLQFRDPTGEKINSSYITPDTIKCSYPLLKIINDNTLLVAYTKKDKKTESVNYQLITH